MAIVQVVRNVLECDGCKAIFGTPNGYASPMEARAEAYAVGWRFPNQVNKYGDAVRTTSDVCSDCAGSWTPQTRASRQRIATQAEVRKWTQ